jgi:hypothetical protein
MFRFTCISFQYIATPFHFPLIKALLMYTVDFRYNVLHVSKLRSDAETGGRFPRAVREPPHRKRLRGLTWTRFSRWSRRLSLQSPKRTVKYNTAFYEVIWSKTAKKPVCSCGYSSQRHCRIQFGQCLS